MTRTVRTVAYKTIAYLEITCGEYRRPCDCCTTFRNTPEGVLPKALYDNKVRDLVLDRILKDGMSVERTLESLRREFLLDLSTGFVYDVLHDHARNSTWPSIAARCWNTSAARFASTNCTWAASRCSWPPTRSPTCPWPSPWSTRTTRTTCGGSSGNLKTWGLIPEVVVTDGSNLYPTVLAELWPDADHQLCVFHVIKDINKLILDAVRRMRTAMNRRGKAGRKKKRGRKGAKSKAAAARRGMTVKEKAHFVFKHRHLIVKRRENLTESERDDLTRMLEYLPELSTLRRFADRIYWLFDTPKDLHQASCRRAAIVRDPAFQAVPELVKAMEQLDDGEVPQADGLLEEPVESAGSDQQPRGADQPDVPVPGEGAVQVAAAADAGAVRGVDAGRDLERMDPGREDEGRGSGSGRLRHVATPVQTTIKPGRMSARW